MGTAEVVEKGGGAQCGKVREAMYPSGRLLLLTKT